MLFFRLTINYQEKLPKVKEKWIVHQNKEFCIRCGTKFVSDNCQKCQEFGPIYRDTKMYQLPYKYPFSAKEYQVIGVKLTELQQLASEFIINHLNSELDILIWAVCGAGKTEITFAVIAKYLTDSKFIAFVIPRRDLLLEIYNRLIEQFPKAVIGIMSGDIKENPNAQMYVLTPNQLLRFKNCFSLIICDEVDAYPFMEDPRLMFAVTSARYENSKVIYLTSTPDEKLLNRNLEVFTINRRWHGYLLPEPELQYLNRNLFIWGYIPKRIKELLNNQRKLLIFVGNIDFGNKVLRILKFKGYDVRFVHAKSLERQQIIEEFRENHFAILITTTILERGMTFTNINVLVLDADYFSYNVSSLVQIAGRVNRKKDDQKGEVIFAMHLENNNIRNAILQIKKMNKN